MAPNAADSAAPAPATEEAPKAHRRRSFNHNGEGGTNAPQAPITKPRGVIKADEFITTTDAFIATARAMTARGLSAAPYAYPSSPAGGASHEQGGGLGEPIRRVDACGPPFLFFPPPASNGSASSSSSSSDTPSTPTPYERSALKHHLYSEVEALLACGTRVGGSGSKGYKCAMQYLRDRMRCVVGDKDAAANGAEGGEGPLPTSRRWWAASINTYDKVSTVVGERSFSNFVAEFTAGDEAAYGHLVLAAHWDSKEMPADPATGKPFLAATDSAVPVVIILEIMKYVSTYAETLRAANGGSDEGLVVPLPKISVLLFDGEEAFLEWKGEDNTYGSRLEARRWKKERRLGGISTFMLLDLLGAADGQLHNLFHGQSGRQYAALRNIEMAFADADAVRARTEAVAERNRIRSGSDGGANANVSAVVPRPEWRHWPIGVLGKDSVAFTSAEVNVNGDRLADRPASSDQLASNRRPSPPKSNQNKRRVKGAAGGAAANDKNNGESEEDVFEPTVPSRDDYFPREPLGIRYAIEDDHIPWLRERVPILHLISVPFPKVWHTLDDDGAHVHYDAVYEYLRVFTEFVLSYTRMGADPQRA